MTTIEIHNHLKDINSPNDLDKIISKLPKNEFGHLGFENINELKNWLEEIIFGNAKKSIPKPQEIKSLIHEIIIKSNEITKECSKIEVFLFPCTDEFTINNLDGMGGYSFNNTIILTINNTSANWQNALKNSIGHELVHAIQLNYIPRERLIDDLIYDGIAEHYCEKTLNLPKQNWTNAITKKQANKILQEIKPKLETTSEQLTFDLFYYNDKYPLWSGYTIGYLILKKYLKTLNKIDWAKIIKEKPTNILKKIDYELL